MKRSLRQQLMFVLAIAFALAPFGFGMLRYMTRTDTTGLWMALASGAGAMIVRVMATTRGIKGSTVAVLVSTLAVATIAAGTAAILIGATSGVGVWMVAFVLGLCWMASLLFAALSRPATSR